MSDLAVELDGLTHGTVIQMFSGEGAPINVALRIDNLDGEVGWALAGHADPWTSERVALGIAAAEGRYTVVVAGEDYE